MALRCKLIKIIPNGKSKIKSIMRTLGKMATKFDEHETLALGLKIKS